MSSSLRARSSRSLDFEVERLLLAQEEEGGAAGRLPTHHRPTAKASQHRHGGHYRTASQMRMGEVGRVSEIEASCPSSASPSPSPPRTGDGRRAKGSREDGGEEVNLPGGSDSSSHRNSRRNSSSSSSSSTHWETTCNWDTQTVITSNPPSPTIKHTSTSNPHPSLVNPRILPTLSVRVPIARILRSRTRLQLLALTLTFTILALAVLSLTPLGLDSALVEPLRVYSGLGAITTPSCPDPYGLPGFFLHSSSGGESGRWIPYTQEVLDVQGPATIPTQRDDTRVPKEVEKYAMPNYYDRLRDKAKRKGDPELQFLKGRTVLIQGCSLDRYVLFGFCRAVKGVVRTAYEDRTGLHSCRLPDIDFEIQMWFNYGATYLPGRPDSKRVELKGPTDFETRIRDYYRPKMKELRQDRAPDLIIYASGTWDLTTLMFDYYHEALEKGVDVQQQAMSWQELAFHRRRLLEMRSFLQTEWPNVPILYRPPTYPTKAVIGAGWRVQGNESDVDFLVESTYRIHESAYALSATTHEFPLFRWAEKLIGSHDYISRNHFRENSPVTQLYIDMALYYVKLHTVPGASHCSPRA